MCIGVRTKVTDTNTVTSIRIIGTVETGLLGGEDTTTRVADKNFGV